MRSGDFVVALLASIVIVGGSCQNRQSDTVRTFMAEGRVISVAGDRRSVTIQHEDIEGFMREAVSCEGWILAEGGKDEEILMGTIDISALRHTRKLWNGCFGACLP